MTDHSTDSGTRPGEENVPYYERLAANYDLFFGDLNRNMAEEGEWLARVLSDHGVKTVLDASCGAGRQAIPLAVRGFEVRGADPSAEMLRQATRLMAQQDIQFPLDRCGFAELPTKFDGEFDAVIALGNGLCNLSTREEILTALRAMRRCCREEGICVIGIKDFAQVRARGERFHGHRIADAPGARTILFEIWDFEGTHLVATAFLVQQEEGSDGQHWRTEAATTREYMLEFREFEQLAARAGFTGFARLDHPSEAAFLLTKIPAGIHVPSKP